MSEISKKFTTQEYEAIYKVEEEESGMRLDQYCAIFLQSFSRQQIKKKIAAGEVQIFNRPFPHKASVKVYHNEKVRLFTPRGTLEDEYWRGEKLELEFHPTVLFEDEEIIVISKPPYMTTHPSGKHLFNCATVYFEEKLGHTIHSIHRLDRETSGVQVLGKKPSSAQRFTDFFERELVVKCYFLIAHKHNKSNLPFIANERLGQEDDFLPRLFVHNYPEDSNLGKHATTRFEPLFENDHYLIALAFPKTGRQHQIRAHAAFHGWPLVGDKLYSGDPKVFMRFKDEVATKADHDLMQLSRHALHAIGLTFPYPNKNDAEIFRAPLPIDLLTWVKEKMPTINLDELNKKIDTVLTTGLSEKKYGKQKS